MTVSRAFVPPCSFRSWKPENSRTSHLPWQTGTLVRLSVHPVCSVASRDDSSRFRFYQCRVSANSANFPNNTLLIRELAFTFWLFQPSTGNHRPALKRSPPAHSGALWPSQRRRSGQQGSHLLAFGTILNKRTQPLSCHCRTRLSCAAHRRTHPASGLSRRPRTCRHPRSSFATT